MKNVYLVFVLLMISSVAFSQLNTASPFVVPKAGSLQSSVMHINSQNDQHFNFTNYSPLMFPDFRLGRVLFKSKTQFENVYLNFDIVHNQFYYIRSDSFYELPADIEEIRIYDSIHPENHTLDLVFKNHLSNGKILNPETFVQVLSVGRITLVKEYLKQYKWYYQNIGSVTNSKKLMLDAKFFSIKDFDETFVTLDTHSLKKITANKKEQMQQFLQLNKLHLNTEADFIQAVGYYN